MIQSSNTFNGLTDNGLLSLFGSRKRHIEKTVAALVWPANNVRKDKNRYAGDPLTVTCIVLRLLCSHARCNDIELLFGIHTLPLSEQF